MDPLGFALENYDAIGRYRAADEGRPIDASGVTPDGVKFEGLAGLRGIMEGRREEFVSTATEKLLVYALGRGVEYYDQPAIGRSSARRRPAITGGRRSSWASPRAYRSR